MAGARFTMQPLPAPLTYAIFCLAQSMMELYALKIVKGALRLILQLVEADLKL